MTGWYYVRIDKQTNKTEKTVQKLTHSCLDTHSMTEVTLQSNEKRMVFSTNVPS